ncbi:alpha-L-glutamate ligase, RimK family [Reticulomyxa filosa]|uniref:Alpha-L-glutamate ligase, RimK family n=1 Tax=Reticulomyxa filosa TaxID=46433 RepID=X6MRA0_RETFI|nr:alpha-L-glutamate ligase, RimK family [Reticulomyxa filosa]|eukprot:ETO16191.1 alpha-L-glutamate ligase, RimK family [Reticulomyxa filosa]
MSSFRFAFIASSRSFLRTALATLTVGSGVILLRSNAAVEPTPKEKSTNESSQSSTENNRKEKEHLPYLSISPQAATSTRNHSAKTVWIVSNSGFKSGKFPKGHTLISLKRSLEKRGFDVKILSTYDMDLFLEAGLKQVTREQRIENTILKQSLARMRKIEFQKKWQAKGKQLQQIDNSTNKTTFELPRFVIARTGSTSKFREYSFYRYLESLGVPVVNSPIAINYASNKFLTYTLLAEQNVAVPKTILLNSTLRIHKLIKLLFSKKLCKKKKKKKKKWNSRGFKSKASDITKVHKMQYPVVLKILKREQTNLGSQRNLLLVQDSSGGRGVFLARDEKELSSLLRMSQFATSNTQMIAQECMNESIGMDVRVWVVGDKAHGACMRYNEKDFRSNVGQGGFPHHFDLDEEGKQLAVRASQVLGLDWSGVDLLLDHKDPITGKCVWRVGEVNSSPGWDTDSDKLIGVNLADAIIEHICQRYNIEVVTTTPTDATQTNT